MRQKCNSGRTHSLAEDTKAFKLMGSCAVRGEVMVPTTCSTAVTTAGSYDPVYSLVAAQTLSRQGRVWRCVAVQPSQSTVPLLGFSAAIWALP